MFVGTRADLPALRATDGPALRRRAAARASGPVASGVHDQRLVRDRRTASTLDEAADFVAFAVGREASRIAARSEAIVPTRLDTVNSNVFLEPDEQPQERRGLRRRHPPRRPDAVRDGAGRRWRSSTDVVLRDLFTDPFFNLDDEARQAARSGSTPTSEAAARAGGVSRGLAWRTRARAGSVLGVVGDRGGQDRRGQADLPRPGAEVAPARRADGRLVRPRPAAARAPGARSRG